MNKLIISMVTTNTPNGDKLSFIIFRGEAVSPFVQLGVGEGNVRYYFEQLLFKTPELFCNLEIFWKKMTANFCFCESKGTFRNLSNI